MSGSFPGIPRFRSSVCVQYNTRKRRKEPVTIVSSGCSSPVDCTALERVHHMVSEWVGPLPCTWFSWGEASLPEGKSRCLGLVQLRVK